MYVVKIRIIILTKKSFLSSNFFCYSGLDPESMKRKLSTTLTFFVNFEFVFLCVLSGYFFYHRGHKVLEKYQWQN